MGYYSDVAVVLKKKDYPKLLEYARNNNPYTLDFIEAGVNHAPTPTGDDFVYLLWNGVKWYSTDGEIINDFLKTLPDDDYDFLRIGEDYDDWESHWGDNVCTLCYRREIDFDPY